MLSRHDIQQTVRDTVYTEFFWRDLFTNEKVKEQVSSSVKEMLPRLMRDMLPGLVSQELMTQIPAFLSQNVQMQRILDNHVAHLNQELEVAARKHLTAVVQDPAFHEVNRAFFSAITQKNQEQLNVVKAEGDRAIQALQNDYEVRLAKLTTLTQRLEDSEKEQARLRSSISTLQLLGGITVITASAVFGWGFIQKD